MLDLTNDLQEDTPSSAMSDGEYLIQSRRAFVGGVASTTLLGTCAICATGRNARQRFFANMMNSGMSDYEALPEVRRFKSQLFGTNIAVGDDVLEIGIGSAPNVKYYSDRVGKLMAVRYVNDDDDDALCLACLCNSLYYASIIWQLEPNREFDEFIIQSVASTSLRTKVDIVPGFAEQIPKKDASVDVVRTNTEIVYWYAFEPNIFHHYLMQYDMYKTQVIGTMVMCSVNSVSQSLKEIHRVLKPGGRYIFTEHVTAPDNAPFLTMAQQLADPLQKVLAEGCHLRRDPGNDIFQTFGHDNVQSERFIVSAPPPSDDLLPPHFLISPHLIGVATKAA